jgi:hypothetical protein
MTSGIPIAASDNHHTFTFFQCLQNGNQDASRDLLLLQTGQRREENSLKTIRRVRQGLIFTGCGEILDARIQGAGN